MATLAEIRAAILAKLKGIAGSGVWHDYERFAARESDFRALYKYEVAPDQYRIRGGFVQRQSTSELDLGLGEVRRIHRFRIVLFESLDDADATGRSFDDRLEDIAAAFRADRTLGGLVDDNKDMASEFGEAGIQIDAVEPVMFAGVLCHRAMLRLATETTEPTT